MSVVANNWDKVTVIAGEPCLARLSLLSLLGPTSKVKRFYKGDDISNLKTLLSANMMIKPKVILYDPNADMLNLCLPIVESGKMTNSLIVMVSGDNIDGRWSFYSKAQKNKRLVNYSYIESGDQQTLLKYLSGWQTDSKINITGEGRKWLVDNAPIISVKLKTGTKKDCEVYDLEMLDAELTKLLVFAEFMQSEITVDYLKNFCNFTQTNDIWNFVKCMVTGDYCTSFEIMEDVYAEHGLSSIVWLFNSQIAFLIQVKDLMQQGLDSNGIAAKMNYGRYFNKYTNDDWEDIESPTAPNINPWRIKKAMETLRNPYCTMDRLLKQQQSVCNAIIDSHSGMPEDIIMSFLVMSMCGVVPCYPESHLVV